MPGLDFSRIRAIILDMDGVLWSAQQPIGELPSIFSKIRELGWKFVLASNNSTVSTAQFLEKLRSFGVNLEAQHIINSAEVTAYYLEKHFPVNSDVYIIGEIGLIDTLREHGFFLGDHDVIAVVVGMDRQLSYEKLKTATLLIRSGIPFIGTNPDFTYPTPEGQVPGAGAIIAAVEAATDTKPIIMGKPQIEMFRVCLERLGCRPDETLVIGDRLETDIVGGQTAGCHTALVLSGVTNLQQAQSWNSPPDLIIEDLTTLIEVVAEKRVRVFDPRMKQ